MLFALASLWLEEFEIEMFTSKIVDIIVLSADGSFDRLFSFKLVLRSLLFASIQI